MIVSRSIKKTDTLDKNPEKLKTDVPCDPVIAVLSAPSRENLGSVHGAHTKFTPRSNFFKYIYIYIFFFLFSCAES